MSVGGSNGFRWILIEIPDSQFCDAISEPSVHPWTKEVLSILLDYVGHVQLCSRLQEHLDSCGDWSDVKDKTSKC